jgi:hypothetical protein
MRKLSRSILPVLGASIAIGVMGVGGTIAHADWSTAPDAVTTAASDVASRSVVLHGSVNPNGASTNFAFELGTTTAYGKATAATSAGGGTRSVPVSYAVSGLLPATTYHARLVAGNSKGVTHGADVTFTTAAEPAGASTPPASPGSSGSSGTSGKSGSTGSTDGTATPATTGPAVVLAPEAGPEMGQTVNVTAAVGTVLVRLPGSDSSVSLSDVASVPVGAILDTRHGTVKLETALPGGHTQTGTFHGGVFGVHQPAGGHGMTELVLRGPKPTCDATGARAAATSSKRHPARNLWGSDHGGRFRTRGSNAVATVRGTSWFMADRCDGTYTRVKTGSVAVRDVHSGRTVVLHAGQSHLTPAAH